MLVRVNLDSLVSWLEYSPDLTNAKVEDPRLGADPVAKKRGVNARQSTTKLTSGWIFGRGWRAFWRATRLGVSRLLRHNSKATGKGTVGR